VVTEEKVRRVTWEYIIIIIIIIIKGICDVVAYTKRLIVVRACVRANALKPSHTRAISHPDGYVTTLLIQQPCTEYYLSSTQYVHNT